MMAETALPERMKTTVLAQEVIRRERNTCREVEREVRLKIRNRMMMKLRLSGYKTSQRINIFLRGPEGVQTDGGKRRCRDPEDKSDQEGRSHWEKNIENPWKN